MLKRVKFIGKTPKATWKILKVRFTTFCDPLMLGGFLFENIGYVNRNSHSNEKNR